MPQTEIVRCEEVDKVLLNEVINLWRDSVVATHHFLTDDDIQKLIPFVEKGIQNVQVFLLSYSNKELSGFIGIHDRKVEMLFIAPSFFNKGIGKALITVAINDYEVIYVDVNEQNVDALGFYKHLGFNVYEKHELDDCGNPFPILKMKIE